MVITTIFCIVMEVLRVKVETAKKAIVSQSNKLIEARYSLTAGEQKIILLLISMISPDDVEFKDYEMRVSDFSEIMEISSKSIYERIEEILERLLSRVIHIREEKGFLKIGWVSSARYIEGEGLIQLSFDKKLKPYLLQLKSHFTKYNLFVITRLKSSYSIRIYMLLKQYEKIGKREFCIIDLKENLGIESGKYSTFKSFRQWVLNRVKKEFEAKDKKTGEYNSDITFDLETIKTGRRITRLRFIIKKHKVHSNCKNPAEILINPIEKETETPAQKALAYYGIIGATAKKYLAEQTEDEILQTVYLLELRKNNKDKEPISNVKSYLVKLLNEQAGKKSPAELEAEEKAKRKEALRKEQQRKEREEKKREECLKKCESEIKKAFLATLNEAEKDQIIDKIKAEHPAISDFIKNLEQRAGFAFLGSYIPDYETKKQACLERYLTT